MVPTASMRGNTGVAREITLAQRQQHSKRAGPVLLENSPDVFDAKGGVQAGSLCTEVIQHRAEKGPELLEDGPNRVDAW